MIKWIYLFGFAFLFFMFVGLELQQQRIAQQQQEEIQNYQITTRDMEARLEKLEGLEPDIGDYMKQFQLDMAKLWFAEKYQNKDLALYEIQEMKETIQAIGILKPVINQVDVAGVLQSIESSQIAAMESAIQGGKSSEFVRNYSDTLLACNECHHAVGKKFNHIIIPVTPPVSNQDWRPSK